MIGRTEKIGEKYDWHEETSCIIDRISGRSRPDSDYTAKVDVYEDRVKGWFLDVAKTHVDPNSSAGDHVAVMVAMAYIEAVEQYRRGAITPPPKIRRVVPKRSL